MPPKRTTICDKHELITSIARDLKEVCEALLKKENITTKQAKQKIRYIIHRAKRIEDITENAREDGQNMEDRLRDYHNAVERLGFMRDKEK